MTTVSVKKELLEELVDSRLKVITGKINNILKKWNYTSAELFLTHAADGTLEEAEPDAISLTNLLDKREELYRLKSSWNSF
jgi:phosphopentomutase